MIIISHDGGPDQDRAKRSVEDLMYFITETPFTALRYSFHKDAGELEDLNSNNILKGMREDKVRPTTNLGTTAYYYLDYVMDWYRGCLEDAKTLCPDVLIIDGGIQTVCQKCMALLRAAGLPYGWDGSIPNKITRYWDLYGLASPDYVIRYKYPADMENTLGNALLLPEVIKFEEEVGYVPLSKVVVSVYSDKPKDYIGYRKVVIRGLNKSKPGRR
jgi:hypothetical protein